jgi:hypothetical protein
LVQKRRQQDALGGGRAAPTVAQDSLRLCVLRTGARRSKRRLSTSRVCGCCRCRTRVVGSNVTHEVRSADRTGGQTVRPPLFALY